MELFNKILPDKGSLSADGKGRRKFPKRYYSSLRAVWRDLVYLLSRRDRIKKTIRDERISPAFRERLMMAVTEENNCRYCRTFHIGQSYRAGISSQEIQSYLSGLVPDETPEDQRLAVLYAKNWAEGETGPDPALRQSVQEKYGLEMYESIELILRMINMGNLLGNSWDYLLYKLTFGKRGI
jgi:AhpD family alkylhydroperoxidase